jgi:hypothetical protein
MAEIAFRTAQLSKSYGSGMTAVHALRGTDLVLPAGEFTAMDQASRRSSTSWVGLTTPPQERPGSRIPNSRR